MSNENTAITPYIQLKSLIADDESIQSRFNMALGDRGPAFMASILNVVASNEQLQQCEPNSILIGAAKAAVLDLPIEPALGFAWLIPYKQKDGRYKAQFQIGYKGLIQLALRTGLYDKLHVAEIYEGERIVEDRITGDIRLNGVKKSDDIAGLIAYFKLKTGLEKYNYMSLEDIRAHAERYSRAYHKKDGPWQTEFIKMGKKTVLKLLLSKYGIVTVQMRPYFTPDADEADEADEDIVEGFAELLEDREAQLEGGKVVIDVFDDEDAAPVSELDAEGNPKFAPVEGAVVISLQKPSSPDDYTTYYNQVGAHISKEEAREILKACNNDAIAAMGKVVVMLTNS